MSTDSAFHLLAVQNETGWEVLETIPVDDATDVQTAIRVDLDSVME